MRPSRHAKRAQNQFVTEAPADNFYTPPKPLSGPTSELRARVRDRKAQIDADAGITDLTKDPNIWMPQRGSQYAFHANPDTFELLYGGAAGGGKSDSLLMEALRHVHIPGYRAILFRRTYPELEKSLVPRAYEVLYGQAKPVNKGTEWTFPNGATIYLSHLQHEEDKEKHKSAEYDYEGFDELTSFSESQYVYLFSRCRGKNPNIPRRIRASTNPSGTGHSWVKKRFIDPDPSDVTLYATIPYEFAYGWKVDGRTYTTFSDLPEGYVKGEPAFREVEYNEYKENKSGLSRAFIPALLWGNTKLLKADPNYVQRLRALPMTQQRALLYGEWDVFEGQFFSEWDPTVHVVEPFDIPPHWQRFVGIDYGFHDPMSALWIAVDEKGKCYVYRELYGSKMSPSQQAENILALSKDERIEWYAADPSMWQHRGGESFAEIYDRITDGDLVLTKSNNSRPAGWAIIHEMLLNNQLFVFENCKNLIRTLPMMQHSRRSPDDMESLGVEDHCLVGQTLIDTLDGQVPIKELVGKEFLVHSLGGPRRAGKVRKTQSMAEIWRAPLSNGSFLTATPNHLVFTHEGWVPFRDLTPDHVLVPSSLCHQTPSCCQNGCRNLMENATTCAANTFKRGAVACISPSGKLSTGSDHQATISITLTTTEPTTRSPILSVKNALSTFVSTCRAKSAELFRALVSWPHKQLRRFGIVRLKARPGTNLTEKPPGPTALTVSFFANNVAKPSQPDTVGSPSSVIITARPKPFGHADVYNMEVEGTECFSVEGGVIVHNCADSLRYALLTYRGFNASPERTSDGDEIPSWWHDLKKRRKHQTFIGRTTL